MEYIENDSSITEIDPSKYKWILKNVFINYFVKFNLSKPSVLRIGCFDRRFDFLRNIFNGDILIVEYIENDNSITGIDPSKYKLI